MIGKSTGWNGRKEALNNRESYAPPGFGLISPLAAGSWLSEGKLGLNSSLLKFRQARDLDLPMVRKLGSVPPAAVAQ
jgi:hypothetical protein